MKKISVITTILLIIVVNINAQDNSTWRGPQRDGIYPEKNLLTKWPEGGLNLIWKYDGLGIGYTSAAVIKEKVFITGTTDSTSYLFAFNHNGELLWKKELGK